MGDRTDEVELTGLAAARRDKLDRLIELGVNPYPYRFRRTHLALGILDGFDRLERSRETVAVAGRLMSVRGHGRTTFGHIQDPSGRIQLYLKSDTLGDDLYAVVKLLDLGDFVGAAGPVFRSRTGEITVEVRQFQLLSKSVRPLPVVKEKLVEGEKVVYDRFSDKELRYRRRYLDLALNLDVLDTFRGRSLIIKAVREYLDSNGYLEVETPVLQPIYGGASARPFMTHHNALDIDLYLRISDELYLKRLIIGGMEKVYEFCKDFRNEGLDRLHNPEFTLLEIYEAYSDYNDMMDLTEAIVVVAAQTAKGSLQLTFQGVDYDLTPPWERVSLHQAIKDRTGADTRGLTEAELKKTAVGLGIDEEGLDGLTAGQIVHEIFEAKVQPHLIQPTFITDYPVDISPLAKRHRSDPGLAERFELFVAGQEIANAFSELNDPADQRQRFEAQMRLKQMGQEEAQVLDEDFLAAMEYGMPPTGGLGIGIDRLVMVLLDVRSIRDVILFPQMRPDKGERPGNETS